jgi:hypothetical protein
MRYSTISSINLINTYTENMLIQCTYMYLMVKNQTLYCLFSVIAKIKFTQAIILKRFKFQLQWEL